TLHWHPTISGLLLIHCLTDESVVHLFNTDWATPRILTLPLDKPGGRLEATWLPTSAQQRPKVMLTNAHNYIIESPYESEREEISLIETGDIVPAGPEDMFDEGNSMDLSPIKLLRGLGGIEPEEREESTGSGLEWEWSGEVDVDVDVDDTFHFRRQNVAAT
ncbi:MAG: hypothetical protein LQ347_005475, partial [Umbilicaria vellea]